MVYDIRLATTEAGLSIGYLIYSWGLPEPQLPQYQDHASRSPLSSGGEALRGHSSVSLLFEKLTTTQMATLRKLVEDALDSGDGLLYATVDKSWRGDGPTHNWVDIKGEPSIPSATPTGGASATLFENVVLNIRAVEVVNDPATGL